MRWVAGIGTVGFAGGAGTYGIFRDRVAFDGAFESSGLDIELGIARGDATPASYAGDSVSVQFDDISPGWSGRSTIGVRSCLAPADISLQLSTTAADSATLLDELSGVVTVVRPDGSSTRLAGGTLTTLLDVFSDGVSLGPCVGCDPTSVAIQWTMSEEPPTSVYGESLSLTLSFDAARCGERTTQS